MQGRPEAVAGTGVIGARGSRFAAYRAAAKDDRQVGPQNVGKDGCGAAALVHGAGPTIFSGRTQASKSAPLNSSSASAASRSVIPLACACLATLAALS